MKKTELSEINVVFDSFDDVPQKDIGPLIAAFKKAFVVEPFVAYHRKRGPFPGFPKPFPKFVTPLLDNGALSLILANDISAKTIYGQATDLAVQSVEAVFAAYEARFGKIFTCVQKIVGSGDAVNAFKNSLCQQLAEFYALNIYLHRLQEKFPGQEVRFYSDVNVRQYRALLAMVQQTKQVYFEHPFISFAPVMEKRSRFGQLRIGIFINSILLIRAIFGLAMDFAGMFRSSSSKRKEYLYAVTVIAPNRQLKNPYGRVDFLVDDKMIKKEDVVYLPLSALTPEQENLLSQLPGQVQPIPSPKKHFSNGSSWLQLFFCGLQTGFPYNGPELKTAYLILSQYFLWQTVLKTITFKNLVTHCDFGVYHVGRNIALHQAGVETWYFTDSMNLGSNLRKDEYPSSMRHPFWTYLTYDHFVTWNGFIKEFIQSHPNAVKNYHVVGCLWSQSHDARSSKPDELKRSFTVGAFDTTYSLNGFADYAEGILFAKHLLELVERDKDIIVLLKEKKDRSLHQQLHPQLAAQLVAVYDSMDQHPRIKVLSKFADTGEVMDRVDMVVSFPFTSTTYEALSRRVPAVWHDPLECYRDTPYGKLGNVMTHGLEPFIAKVQEIKVQSPERFFARLDQSSNLLDSFNDRKAVDRFREILSKKST